MERGSSKISQCTQRYLLRDIEVCRTALNVILKAIMKLDAALIMTRFNKRNPSNTHGYRVSHKYQL